MTEPIDTDTDLDLEEAIELLISRGVARVNVGCPAVIVAYDKSTSTAKVQPVIRARTGDGAANRLPPISGVPVMWRHGGGIVESYPLAVGDDCWLSFGDRSIEEWLQHGRGDVTPQSVRRFALTDAVCFPMGRPVPRAPKSTSETAYVVGEDEGALPLRLQIDKGSPAGRGIALGDGTNDLLKIVADLVDVLVASTFGPYPINPANAAQLVALKEQLDLIRKVT